MTEPTSVLVTGGGGFIGQALARLLVAQHVPRVSLVGTHAPPSAFRAACPTVEWQCLDVRRSEDVAATIDHVRPDVIVHLAGISFPPDADNSASATFEVNVLGAINVFAAAM